MPLGEEEQSYLTARDRLLIAAVEFVQAGQKIAAKHPEVMLPFVADAPCSMGAVEIRVSVRHTWLRPYL